MAKWTRLQLAAALMLGLAGPAAADQTTTDTDRATVPVMTALGMRELPALPQKIVVLDIAAAATLDNALVTGTEAWKKGQVIYLDSAAIYIAGGGIQSMTATLEQIRAGFAVGG
ncbi:hypothetical protein [Phaeobacter inhibens]|uniref:hypothetical protein n=1 Tax=Phaeobacter inhibens TaxID=221822 RepID=UPI00076BB7C1|nr:hypothetical protein [Phaeobacter inhibens]KXF92780.1 hypothetical protein AT574_00530 [Phaeobacter inhibens]WHP70762.1 hypothetical protein QMZ01_20775 [Phaeobacter inhibens]